MTHTKEEKKAYFEALRQSWQKSKELAEQDQYKGAFLEAQMAGVKMSLTGFVFTKSQMEKLNLEGTPYIDAKTFQGWRNVGFMVKKGERSVISGITWLKSQSDEKQVENFANEMAGGKESKQGFIFPKEYKLFHRSQVAPINA